MNNEDVSIPPLIQTFIDGMKNKTTPMHIRKNYESTLTKLHKVLTDELNKFRSESGFK
jgi:hypothetical protein